MLKISRRDFLAGAAALTVPLRAAERRPNILFLMVDEMRWDAMSWMKHPVAETPALGRLLQELMRLGMSGETLVLFTADHGNMLGDRGRWFKGLQYEGSAHVPLLWKGPQGAPENKGQAIDKPVDTTDLLPSILETAGIPIPESVQGRSFVKLACGWDSGWKPRVFSQLRSGMVLDGGWKLIDNSAALDGSGPFELFDLRSDPKEERNLAEEPKQRDRVAQYRKELAAWRADRPAPIRIAGMATPAYAQNENEVRQPAGRSRRKRS